MPDIFIPADTSHYTPFYGEIVRKGLLTDFINNYVDNNRQQLTRKYKDSDDFVKSFSVSDKFFNEFLAFCKEKGVEPKDNEINISGPQLKNYLKGFILRNLFDFNSYIKFLNKDDVEVIRALDVLKNNTQFAN